MNTTLNSPVKDKKCHSTLNILASSHDSGIPLSSPHTLLSVEQGSPVKFSQANTPSFLPSTFIVNPNNIPSTKSGYTPSSKETKT